ncbi:MAG TPA: hypothetical protein VG755_43440 [Nannocystaceae bacterium]|nr:hypothetical protein [Nannocystaceae bacterium]
MRHEVVVFLVAMLGCGAQVPTSDDSSSSSGACNDGTCTEACPSGVCSETSLDATSVTTPGTSPGTTMGTGPGTSMGTSLDTSVDASDTLTTTTSDPDTTTGGTGVCPGPSGTSAEDEPCDANGQCSSGVCLLFSDAPLDADAVCGATPPGDGSSCATRVTGTVFDLGTRAPIVGADVRVAGALNAITNPAGAMALASAVSDGDGRIDATTDAPLNQAIAVMAIVEGDGGTLTITGIAPPIEGNTYAPGVAVHDLWLAPSDRVGAWSDALADDPEIPGASLPLGLAGGVIGLVRDADGDPIAGATVQPDNGDSAAIIRYVQPDDTLTTDATGSEGLFVVIDAGATGEDFSASTGATGTAGSANGALFTLILTSP